MKYGVLTFGYERFSSFQESLKTKGFYTSNLGDNMQSVAVRSLYNRLGITESDIVSINRDDMASYTGEPACLVMSGCFYEHSFPLPENIRPIFLGFQTHEAAVVSFKGFFKQHEPIGCRDEHTMQLFIDHDIKAFVSGCLTLSIAPRTATPNRPKALIIYGAGSGSLPAQVFKHIPDTVLQTAEFVYQRLVQTRFPLSLADREKAETYAGNLLQDYQRRATLVITPLHHAATPCIASGIPVVICRRKRDSRFNFLEQMTPVYTPQDFAQIDWSPSPLAVHKIRDKLTAQVKTAIERTTS